MQPTLTAPHDRDLVMLRNRAITGLTFAQIAKNHRIAADVARKTVSRKAQTIFRDVATLGFDTTLAKYHLDYADYEKIREYYLANQGTPEGSDTHV